MPRTKKVRKSRCDPPTTTKGDSCTDSESSSSASSSTTEETTVVHRRRRRCHKKGKKEKKERKRCHKKKKHCKDDTTTEVVGADGGFYMVFVVNGINPPVANGATPFSVPTAVVVVGSTPSIGGALLVGTPVANGTLLATTFVGGVTAAGFPNQSTLQFGSNGTPSAQLTLTPDFQFRFLLLTIVDLIGTVQTVRFSFDQLVRSGSSGGCSAIYTIPLPQMTMPSGLPFYPAGPGSTIRVSFT